MEKSLFGICPFATAQKILAGKWTLLILYELSLKTMRFNELQKKLPRLTQATLAKQLRMMEENGLIVRTAYNQIPPKVEYSLNKLGVQFKPVLDALQVWGTEYIAFLESNESAKG